MRETDGYIRNPLTDTEGMRQIIMLCFPHYQISAQTVQLSKVWRTSKKFQVAADPCPALRLPSLPVEYLLRCLLPWCSPAHHIVQFHAGTAGGFPVAVSPARLDNENATPTNRSHPVEPSRLPRRPQPSLARLHPALARPSPP